MARVIQKGKKVEILAPAGSYESFRAAIRAGADAVYAGGPRFGARAFADNFTEQMLLEAIDYAHLHGRKLYLTVNTLLKDSEMQELYEYLRPFYKQGLDAVIVQDVGVLEFVRTHFPELPIHASTQMTLTNTEGALFLKEQGAERVVPARELSLEEVREIADKTGMEIECFVHGALCYCYSGQCLLSSLIGGRSGNRGQCAQPCRLPYAVGGKKEYVLSLKDICTLELIPQLVDSGINSFKIEGRMKKPEYVALVTAMYKKYTDLYLQKGKNAFRVDARDKEKLMDIYNRGGFSGGYYNQRGGREMLSLGRPGHAGVPAVKVTGQKGREVTGQALTDIRKGDILHLAQRQESADGKDYYTFGKGAGKGSQVQILVPREKRFAKGTVLYRLRNQELLDEIQKLYGNGTVQEPITGILKANAGKPAKLTVSCGEVSVTVQTKELSEEAKSQPLDSDRIKKQLQKTGNTEFEFQDLVILLKDPVFLPMQRINQLKRQALEKLEKEICGQFHREEGWQGPHAEPEARNGTKGLVGGSLYLSALAESKEQLRAILRSADISRVYMDSNLSGSFLDDRELKQLCDMCHGQGKEFFLAMPHVFRKEAVSFFKKQCKAFLDFGFDGVLIRNYESFHLLKELRFDKKVILDHNLYVFNQQAKQFWEKLEVESFTVPVELNEREIAKLGAAHAELIVYGRLPVMVSAQCIEKTAKGCLKAPGMLKVKDRYQKEFPVRNCCSFCYNIVYNTSPLFLADLEESIRKLGPAGLRLQFTDENACETEEILKACSDIYHRGIQACLKGGEFTRGHFKRGIT